MSKLLRFLGISQPSAPDKSEQADEALHPIVATLDGLDPDRARFFAAFAFDCSGPTSLRSFSFE